MSVKNTLGTALAVTTLSIAMFGCVGQNNNEATSHAIKPASLDTPSNNVIELTPIESLAITDYSLNLCITNTGRKYVEDISALTCNNKGIQYLDGIEQLTELKILHLNFNEIEDITPLVALKQLQTLYVSGNKIYNLDPLSELVDLTELGIQKNAVQDISPLQSLGSLKSLHTHSNQINDFSILNDLDITKLSGKNRQES